MGNNVDFVYLCGAPEKIKCPNCKKVINSQLDDWDIDCGTDHDGKGTYKMEIECDKCNYQIPVKIELNCKTFIDGKELITVNNKCSECGEIMDTEEEINFGQCDHCCAWKYRDNSK